MPIFFKDLDSQEDVENVCCMVYGNDSIDLGIGTAHYGEIPILIIGETTNTDNEVGRPLKEGELLNAKVSMFFENPKTIDILIENLQKIKKELNDKK